MQGRMAVLPPIGLRGCKGPQGEPRALAFSRACAVPASADGFARKQGQQHADALSCLQDLGFAVWIMGLVSGCALGVSFLLAVVYLCVTVFSGAARHYRYISTPAA